MLSNPPLSVQRLKLDGHDLPDRVAKEIVRLISENNLEPGARLPSLDELTQALGVSRTALREGLKLLNAWGAVEIRHGVGTFVSRPSPDVLSVPLQITITRSARSLLDLMQVREVLEPQIAAIAAQRATPNDIEQLQSSLIQFEEATSTGGEVTAADLAFHVGLARATGSDVFLIMITPVVDLFHEIFEIALHVPGAHKRGLDYHRIIFRHVRDHDAHHAKEAMHAHIMQVRRDIQPILDQG